MGDAKGTVVLLKDVFADSELGHRVDEWFQKQGLEVFRCGGKFELRDLQGNLEDTFDTEDDLLAEYNFQVSNSNVPRKCRES